MAHRLLHLGLDACDAATVRRFMRAGELPALTELVERGRTAPTRAPYGTFVGSTWPSFATGRTPDHHGHWCWIEIDRFLDHHHVSPRRRTGRAFWEDLDAAGVRMAVLDVPHSLQPSRFDGTFVSEWGAHDRLEGPQWTPHDLFELAGVGPHPVGSMPPPPESQHFAPCDDHHRSGHVRDLDQSRALVDDLLEGIARKQRLLEHVLDAGHDAVVAVFCESHCVGHQLWHLHDRAHEWHDPTLAAALGDPLLAVYRRLDRAVGELVDRVDPDTLVLIHLSHGMTAHHDGTHLLDPLLWRIEQVGAGARSGRLSRAASPISPLSGVALRAAHRRAGRKPVATAPSDRAGRAARRFFQSFNNTVVGGVRVNLIGREVPGVVPRSEFDDELTRLEQELREPVNLATGRPAVRRTVRADEVHERHGDDHFPDLYVEWDRSAQLERVWSPRLGVVHVPYDHWRTGDHHDVGLLIAAGPGVEPGHEPEVVQVTDLAPTICRWFGVELEGVDGTPLEWLGVTEPARG